MIIFYPTTAIVESPFVAMEYDRVIHTRLASMARERYNDGDKTDFFSILSTEQTEITRGIITAANAFTRNQRPGDNNGPRYFGEESASRSDAAREKAPGPPAVIPKEGFPPKNGRRPMKKKWV